MMKQIDLDGGKSVKKKPIWLRVLLVILLFGVLAVGYEAWCTQNPYTLALKRQIKYEVLGMTTQREGKEIAGLEPGYSVTLYEDGVAVATPGDSAGDRKKVYEDGQVTRLVDYLAGCQVDLPRGMTFDFSCGPLYVNGENADCAVTISREKATYASKGEIISFELANLLPFLPIDRGVERHVNEYEWRFLLDEGWQQANAVTVTQERTDNVQLIHAVLQRPGDAQWDGYTYAVVYNNSREYLRLVFRYDSQNTQLRDAIDRMVCRTQMFDPVGEGQCRTDFRAERPDFWSEETSALYDRIVNSEGIRWGVFTKDIYTTGIQETVPQLEDELDYTFPVILSYLHYSDNQFPSDFMKQNWDNGRVVELTYQVTMNNNEDMFAYTPFLDLYRGELDEDIRAFARQAAAFGHPFLFRLNNEMNSDWTSYSGVVNLCDPQVYIAVWQRFYQIFREEGVDNCIWIYNPNDRNAPPSNWNDSLAYWPGNGYAQMLGVTGYNNGTYYTQWNEQWREFREIYDEVETLYAPHFGDFPWIITEFASSSIGGDKAAWMRDMFDRIEAYPNIKIAVWFSYADFDGDTPARPYWLDETPQTLEAFRQGVARIGVEGWD